MSVLSVASKDSSGTTSPDVSAGSGDVTDGSDFERIEAAFHAWSCAEGTNLRFLRGEDVDGSAQQGDGISSIYWVENESELAQY